MIPKGEDAAQNFEKSSNMAKNEEKLMKCVTIFEAITFKILNNEY